MVKSEEKIMEELIDFISETNYSKIPAEVIEFTKGLILKTLAGMLVGSNYPSGQRMASIIRSRGLPEEVGVIGSGFRTALWEGILFNSFVAHASELEDDRMTAWGEPGYGISWDITVVPVVLSFIEKLKYSGKSLLESVIIGLEVQARTSLFSSDHIGLAFVLGAVGPAASAAKAMGLNKEQIANAIGLSVPNSPGTPFNFGTDGHFFESSLQSLQGVLSAEMANKGLTGGCKMITHLENMLGKENVFPEKIVQDLGHKWLLCETWIKKYPVCFPIHRHIDALLDIMKENSLSYEDVEIVEAHVGPWVENFVDRPNPRSEGDLQFSIQNGLGAALLDKDVSLRHVSREAIDNAELNKSRSKIRLIHHTDWKCKILEAAVTPPVKINVKTKKNKDIEKERKYLIGSPEDPLTMHDIQNLYLKYVDGILEDSIISKSMDIVAHLEKHSNIQSLIDELVYV